RVERAALQPWESGHDHVAIYAYNGSRWLESMFGTLHARAAFVNVNYRYVADELRFVLATSRARAIIYHAAFAPRLAAVRDDLPLLVRLIPVRDDSGQALLPGPVDHEEWLAARRPERLDGHGAWRTIVRERVDQLSICGDAFAQPLLTALREGGYDTSSIRAITSTAAVLSPSVKRALAALLPPGTLFIESLGASEAGL